MDKRDAEKRKNSNGRKEGKKERREGGKEGVREEGRGELCQLMMASARNTRCD